MSQLTRKGIQLLLALFCLALVIPAQADEVKRVVWHVDYADPARLGRMITSINNMTAAYEGELLDYDVRIVFLGAGIRFVTTDPLKNTPFKEDRKLRKAKEQIHIRLKSLNNVKLELCTITVNAVQLDTKTLVPGVTLVPSGVVEIADLQSKGFAYLKAD